MRTKVEKETVVLFNEAEDITYEIRASYEAYVKQSMAIKGMKSAIPGSSTTRQNRLTFPVVRKLCSTSALTS